ncbi:Uncharacterised protein [Chlamydia trachomatis]|nr:Uncharacterised protein [Chlamydia trachomatis]
MQNRLNHKTSKHRMIGSHFVTAARTIGKRPIRLTPAEIAWGDTFKHIRRSLKHVVINNIHNYAYTILMQSANHRLALAYSCRTVVWIARVSTLRHIVRMWIVAPIVKRIHTLTVFASRRNRNLIHSRKIVDWH